MACAARDYALTRSWHEALQPLYRAYREMRDSQASEPASDILPLPAS
jgi:hypothetical protein